MSALSLVSPPKLGGARGGLKERYNSNCSDQPAHTGCGSKRPIPHATSRCDGRQKRRERGYYDLHRYLNHPLLHLLISFLLGISCLRNLGI